MGELEVQVSPPGQVEPDVLAVPIPQAGDPLANGALDARLKGRLQRLLDDGELRGELGQAIVVHVDEPGPRRIAAAGIGPLEQLDADGIRTAASAVARAGRDVGGTLAWLLDERIPVPLDEQARAVVEGIVIGSYRPGRWKTEPDERREFARVVLYAANGTGLAEAAERAARVSRWVNAARDLANSPPNELTPMGLAQRAAELDVPHLTAEALDESRIDELGMGALAAVGRASANPPRLIVQLPVRVIAIVAAAENLVGSESFRPGDILRSASGKTIEITNTDAEGRLVLADALWYARREGATHMVDIATLTGAMELALGDLYGGLFANEDEWRDEILAAAERSGDHLWPFPLHPRFRRYVESDYADLKNASDLRQASPALAAEFLHEFAGDGPWAHIDMSGPAFLERSRGDYLTQRGGTGYGVRLIVELAQSLST
jgi:leucyl aminopeptidase